ncbi:hypothetical protein B0A55_04244 [Friedmanniomyces simplex]|uniref:Uncharacterized protein n=1 Tax=Friedmanniomyces simplex TaxID=329884 RepID=A0A4V5NHJ1_9PEZI|nr:hypothetical protein B0A55_04244 [Friedmanniomyces simplex]
MASQIVMAQPAQPSHDPQASISIPNFRWQSADHKLQSKVETSPTPTPNPPLGVLSAFSGNFSGTGFNTIFRPNSGPPSGTTFTNAVTPAPPTAPSENVLELNLTTETLNFGSALGRVPNRGLGEQSDVFLNGVPYVQSVNDVANLSTGNRDGAPLGIHFETGIWMHLPATTADPPLAASIVRMGSIPHGTTINAQSLEPTQTFSGPPVIPAVDLTPFVIGSSPPIKIPFASQTATNASTPRIPQDLSAFIAAGTITQAILTDPNTVLRNANTGKKIIKTEVFTVSTTPSAPELGGGTANIAFLTGTTSAGPNANAATMTATFWINTVQSTLTIPSGSAPLRVIQTPPPHPGARVPSFVVPPTANPVGERTITVTHTEIQYSQTVNLNFAGLTWPHVSVATLVPTAELHVVPEHDDGGAALGPRIVGQ